MPEDNFVLLPSGCRICYQTFGKPTDSALLIIAGHASAMTQKTDELVQLLSPSHQPHYVIRFDHRDTGLSTSFPKSTTDEPVYTLQDMVDDIIGLITHLNLKKVHLMGMSLGGPLAWQTSSQLPDVVATLALILTGPVGRQQLPTEKLPPLNMEAQWLLAEAFSPPEDENDDEGWIQHYMRLDLALATKPPTEEEKAESRRECETTYWREKKSGNLFTKFNHSDASGVRWPRELLREVRCPTVIIHGAKDQLFPLKHAEAMRDDVAGSNLVVIEGCGHELPHRVRQQVADAVLINMKRGIY